MRRLLLLLPLASGCAWMTKPYANDPLVRTRQAVVADPASVVSDEPCPRPTPPEPPVEQAPPPMLKAKHQLAAGA